MDWLTRTDIDRILDTLSADDLMQALASDQADNLKVLQAFNRAAERMGAGTEAEPATTRVKAQDLTYLATRIGEVINVDSPLSGSTVSLLDSAATGE
jgi:hypothetical protein